MTNQLPQLLETKRCGYCKETKNKSLFVKDKTRNDGYASTQIDYVPQDQLPTSTPVEVGE